MAEKQYEENEYWSLDPDKKANLIWSKAEEHKRHVPPPDYRDGLEIIPMPVESIVRGGFHAIQRNRLKRLSGGLLKDYTPEEQFETDLPAKFPGREILRGLKKNRADLEGLTLGKLIDLDGIGEKTAVKIIEYFAAEAKQKSAANGEDSNAGENN